MSAAGETTTGGDELRVPKTIPADRIHFHTKDPMDFPGIGQVTSLRTLGEVTVDFVPSLRHFRIIIDSKATKGRAVYMVHESRVINWRVGVVS